MTHINNHKKNSRISQNSSLLNASLYLKSNYCDFPKDFHSITTENKKYGSF